MKLLLEILICFLAGAGAGIGTGFAGMSAAAVIGPMLASFLGVPAYEAVGIGLVSDVLASAVSAYTYKKSGNLDVKNSLPMMISVLIVTVIGSFVASFLPERAMGSTMQIALIILGLRFILKPVTTTKEQMNAGSAKERLMKAIIGGIVVGFICGFVGAGGGMMMLFVLTSFLGYQMHMEPVYSSWHLPPLQAESVISQSVACQTLRLWSYAPHSHFSGLESLLS